MMHHLRYGDLTMSDTPADSATTPRAVAAGGRAESGLGGEVPLAANVEVVSGDVMFA